ncbi:MAG: hypothetical protein LLG06_00775 [Desulfobacteraceae bacterium]|nr:hypothetical protein [Desulfobacteraceae bacterium]
MRVLVYGHTKVAGGRDVRREIESIIPEGKVEFFSSASKLQLGLKHPENGFSIAVLFCSSRNELSKIKSLSHLLADLGIVLILPGRDDDLVTIGHSLLPRYLTFRDSDFGEVAEVLRRLVNTRKYMIAAMAEESAGNPALEERFRGTAVY